jgi:hypothetical protein
LSKTTVEVRETVSLDIKDKSALNVALDIESFCNSYGQIARHMWKIVYWDISSVKLTRTYNKELDDA